MHLAVPRRATAFGLVASPLLVGKAMASVRWPPITAAATDSRRPGAVVWHDLLTQDLAAAQRFYGELFGWSFQTFDLDVDGRYIQADLDGEPVAGLVGAGPTVEVNASRWIPVISVADPMQTVAALKAVDGDVFLEPTALPGRGTLAVIGLPTTAVAGLLRSETGDPDGPTGADGTWLWTELWLPEPPSLADTLTSAFGLSSEREDDLIVMGVEGVEHFALRPSPVEGLDPMWVSTLAVRDIDAVTAGVPAAGGTILAPADDRGTGLRTAFLADPSGAAFLVQEVDDAAT